MTDAAAPDDAGTGGETRYRFKLYVAGESPLSMRVRENFHRHVARPLGDRVQLEVVDLAANPRLARTERIVATPTLVRVAPGPVVRLVGDLTDFDRIRSLVLTGEDRPPPARPPAPAVARAEAAARAADPFADEPRPPGLHVL